MLHFLHDHDSELKLVSYLNIKQWDRYVKEVAQDEDIRFEVGYIIKLIRDKCGYTIIRHVNKDPVIFTVNNLIAVRINAMHTIFIYNNMIFDANNQTMVIRNY